MTMNESSRSYMTFNRKSMKPDKARNIDILIFGGEKAGKQTFIQSYLSNDISQNQIRRSRTQRQDFHARVVSMPGKA